MSRIQNHTTPDKDIFINIPKEGKSYDPIRRSINIFPAFNDSKSSNLKKSDKMFKETVEIFERSFSVKTSAGASKKEK